MGAGGGISSAGANPGRFCDFAQNDKFSVWHYASRRWVATDRSHKRELLINQRRVGFVEVDGVVAAVGEDVEAVAG